MAPSLDADAGVGGAEVGVAHAEGEFEVEAGQDVFELLGDGLGWLGVGRKKC